MTGWIDKGVELGPGSEIGRNCIIYGPAKIGSNVKIHTGVVIGEPGEHLHKASTGTIVIGDGVTLREYVVVQRGLEDGRGTTIGDGCYIMHGAHVAHDVVIGQSVIASPYVVFGGHVTVLDGANLGIAAGIHQWVAIGGCAMVGMNATVLHDVPTASIVVGSPARVIGQNTEGIKRAGYSMQRMAALVDRYAEVSGKRPGMKAT